MGRKVDFLEKPKKGPGKKTKKQSAPLVPTLPKSNDNKSLSSRQKKRLKNRVQKQTEKKAPIKPASDDENEENVSEEVSEDESGPDEFVQGENGFTDDNNEWLKPKKKDQLDSDVSRTFPDREFLGKFHRSHSREISSYSREFRKI